jgi:hypothetical protein
MEVETAFDKVQQTFTTKTINKLHKERMYLNIIKVLCNKPTSVIMLNVEKMKVFPLRIETRQECSLLTHLFNIFMEILFKE